MKSFFNPRDIEAIFGISYRQIQYWDRTGIIVPSCRRRGKFRIYTFEDLVRFHVAVELLNQEPPRNLKLKWTPQKLRKLLPILEKQITKAPWPLVELRFLIRDLEVFVFRGEVIAPERHGFLELSVTYLLMKINQQLGEDALY